MAPENVSSPERRLSDERRATVAAFISGNIKPAAKTLRENEIQTQSIREFESREYQLEAWEAIWKARAEGRSSVLVHLATGLGKTTIGVMDYAKFTQEQGNIPKPRALFVVHQDSILDQANERFGEIIPAATKQFYKTGQQDLPSADITFATFQSLVKEIHRFPQDYFDYIIYDEAHHTKAKTYEKVVEHMKPKFELALTATPDRMDERDITDHFGEAIYAKGLAEAMADGYLASVDYTLVADDAIKDAIAKGFNPTTIEEIRQLFNVEMRNEEIVLKIQEKKQEIRLKDGVDQVKTIVFGNNIEHVEQIAGLLNATSYHSEIGTKKRQKQILQAFRDGDIEDLVAKDMLNEGVDIPDARLVVFLRSTQSKGIFEQQLGRGLRLIKGKTTLSVLDFVGNVERIEFVKDIAEQYQFYKYGGGVDRRGDDQQDRPVSLKEDNDEREPQTLFEFSDEVVNLLEKYTSITDKLAARPRWAEFSNEELIALAISISPDTPLSTSDLVTLARNGQFMSPATVTVRFGSLGNFQRLCGFEVGKWLRASNEEIIETAKRHSPSKPMTITVIRKLNDHGDFTTHSDIISRFGSMAKFQQECGFDVASRVDWRAFSNEEVIELANQISSEVPISGRKMKELAKKGLFPSESEISERFGSIVEFQNSCGFDVEKPNDWSQLSDEDIVNWAKAMSPNKPLGTKELDVLSKNGKFVSLNLLYRRFGSIAKFQQACGYQVYRWSALTDEEIIAIAKELSPDKPISSKDMTKFAAEGKFMSKGTLMQRFGSIFELQRACGFDVTDWSKVSNDDLVRLAKELSPDKPLTTLSLRELSKVGKFVSTPTLGTRFGSLRNFQKACGF